MSVKAKRIVGVFIALAALTYAAMEIVHIGSVYEEKSLYSYMLKTGDTDAKSTDALAHVRGAASYGRIVAVRVAFGASVFGLVLGLLVCQWRLRKNAP